MNSYLNPICSALRLIALGVLTGAFAYAYAGSRIDNAIPPQPFDEPVDGQEEDEGQGLIDRHDWLISRFSGPLDKDFFARTLAQIQLQVNKHPELLPNASPPPGVPKWRSIGPSSQQVTQSGVSLGVVNSGRVRSILVHPSDPNTVYVLSSGGGLWKTNNFNSTVTTWSALTDSTITTSGGAAALGAKPDTVYLGLGDPFDGIALVGGVMLRSLDGGATWSAPVDLPTAGRVTDVKVDAGAAADVVLVATDGGVYRSTDGGLSYSLAAGLPSTLAVASLAKTSAGWLASTFVQSTSGFGIGDRAAFYLSTDGGATFSQVSDPGNVISPGSRFTLAVGAPGDSIVYTVGATAGNSPKQMDVFKSADGGVTWAALGMNTKIPVNPNADQSDLNVLHGQAWYNQMLVVDPTDPSRNTVHLGGNLSTVKTTDGGNTWRVQTNWLGRFNLPYSHADNHTATVSFAGGSKRIFFGTDGGIFYSDDDGATWSDRKNIGLVNQLLYTVTSSGKDPSSVLTGLQDNGTWLRVNGTTVYNQVKGGDGLGVGWSQSNGSNVLTSVTSNSIYYSTQTPVDQTYWSPSPRRCSGTGTTPGFIETCNAPFYTTIATPGPTADPTGKIFFARSSFDVYKTTDGGQSWNSISTSDSTRLTSTLRGNEHSIAVHPTDINRIAATGASGRVKITVNGGTSWTTIQVPSAITDGFNSSLAWINANSLYLSSENPSFQTSGCWLAKTTNLGATWSKSCAGLPQVPVSKVLVSPADPTGLTAYAATWIGVYRTVNGGLSWEQFGAGLPIVKVSDLYMPARGGFLRIATYGRGLWEITTPR